MKITTNFSKMESIIVELDEHDLARIVLESIQKEVKVSGMKSEIEFWENEDCKTACICKFTHIIAEYK
jgi:tRNA threonylcarbamoyladenosine modification (KEOPS) complex  Pcc1 subunit